MTGQKHLVGVGDLVKGKRDEVIASSGVGESKGLLDDGKASITKSEGQSDVSDINLFSVMLKTPWTLACTILAIPVGITLALYVNDSLGFFTGVLFFLLAFFGAMFKDLNKIEKDRISVVLISFAIVVVFWGAFEQAGGLMNLYTKNKTDRMLLGMEIPASVFQSLNAAFIMIFGAFVANYWARRKFKSKESSSLFKMAIGTVIMGSGFLFMTAAAAEYDSTGSSAMYWLILAYLFHTIGELCASPVSLSFITKLSPLRYGSIMMGTYFAMTGFGNKLAATIGESSESLGEYVIFTGIAVFCAAFGLLIIVLLKKLKRLTHGAEDNEGTINEEAEGFELADGE